jgi:hypothetical protein
MIIFEIKGEKRLFRRLPVNQVIWLWGLVHILYLVLNLQWYLSNVLLAETIAVAVVLLRMLSRKERNINSISFDDERKRCIICYYIFFVVKVEKEIQYERIHFRYGRSRYLRGIFPIALQIIKGRFLVAEIREQYNIGWSNEEIITIYDFIKENKLIKHTIPVS